MRKCSQRFRMLCLVCSPIVIGFALLILVWSALAEYQRSLREARDAIARGRLAQLQLSIENYKAVHGHAFRRVSINGPDERTSWRELIAPFFDDETMRAMAAHPDRKENIQSDHVGQVAPIWLRVPFDTSDAHFTSLVAVYDETDQESDDPPWAFVAMANTGIRWNEPKDFTLSEFEKLLNGPQTSSQPIAVLTASGQLGSIVDGSMIRFFLRSSGQSSIHRFLLNSSRRD